MSKKQVKVITKKKVIKGKAEDKVARVMQEFKDGKLKSSSGETVTDRKQALAIALSEAGLSKSVFKGLEVAEIKNKLKVMKGIITANLKKEMAKEDSMTIKLMDFLKKNPRPEDEKIHSFAEQNGMTPPQIEEMIYGILTDFLTGGKSKGKIEMNNPEMKKGIAVEMEHTGNKYLAAKIASDHLKEIPDYYTRLEKMEAEAKGSEKSMFSGSKDWEGQEIKPVNPK